MNSADLDAALVWVGEQDWPRKLHAGEFVVNPGSGFPGIPELSTQACDSFRGHLMEAAAGRVCDVRSVFATCMDVVRSSAAGTSLEYGSTSWDLPLLSPPRIGVHGLWMVDSGLGALVIPDPDDDRIAVIHLVSFAKSGASENGYVTMFPGAVEVFADGHVWHVRPLYNYPEVPDS